MNALRLVASGLLTFGLVLTLPVAAKANANKDKLVGVWEVVKAEQGALPVGSTVEFGKDGKAKVTAVREGKESSVEGTFAVEGSKLNVTLKHGEKDVK